MKNKPEISICDVGNGKSLIWAECSVQPYHPGPLEGEDRPSQTLSSGLAAMNLPLYTDGGALWLRNPHSLPGQAELCMGQAREGRDTQGQVGKGWGQGGAGGDRSPLEAG